MGGKTWQTEEEHLFWRVLVPQSPEGVDPSDRRFSWKQCAELMHRELGHRGYRDYNKQLLYEHFYQNCKSERPSPRARSFVREYLTQRGPAPIERPRSSRQRHSKPLATTRLTGATEPDGISLVNTGPSESVTQGQEPYVRDVGSTSDGKPSAARIPLPTGAPAGIAVQGSHSASPAPWGVQPTGYASRPPRMARVTDENNAIPRCSGTAQSDGHGVSGASSQCVATSSSEVATTSRSTPDKPHGPLFQALLLATSVSSIENSTASSLDGRSRSISSSTTSVSDDGDDMAGEGATKAKKPQM